MPRVPLAAAGTVAALLLLPAVPAHARDLDVTSFDGAKIVTHFFPGEGRSAGSKGPTVLLGHGWAGTGSTNENSGSSEAGAPGTGPLRRAGYNVLTWDARGFGGSDGVVQVDSPAAEGRDVQALLDAVAEQPEALVDDAAAKDPRVGMVGGSYAGGIQLVTAGLPDRRLDAIVPDIAWHSLTSSLYQDSTFKGGWGNLLVAAGVPAANAQKEGLDPHITAAATEGNLTGRLSAENAQWFADRGPGDLVKNITIPTLLTQGTVDTLFPLDEAITNYGLLRASGAPVKMLWHCGGHGTCNTRGGTGDDPGHVERAVLAWLKRYLDRDTSVSTGDAFEWVADDGKWRSAKAYPMAAKAPLVGEGAGTLAILPGSGSGSPVAASPDSSGLTVPIAAPAADEQAVGVPTLRLTYRGTSATPDARVYAQIVDTVNGVVLGNQATPIPVTLDGADHTVERPLEAIAASLTPASRLELQIVPATQLYAPQRATGTLTATAARIEVPTVDPAATTAGPPATPIATSPVPISAPPKVVAPTKRLKVTVGFPGSRKSHRATRRLRTTIRASRTITGVKVTLRDARNRTLGTAKLARVAGKRTFTLKLKRALKPGRHRVTVSYAGGRTLRTIRFRR